MNTGDKRQLKNQTGISLVEVMVSVAILGVVTMGAVSLGDQVAKQARMNRVGNNVFQLYENIRAGTLLDEDCRRFLGNPNATVPLNFDPTVAAGNGAGGTGQDISFMIVGQDGVERPISGQAPDNVTDDLEYEVESLKLVNAMPVDDGDPADPQRYLAYIEMGLRRPNVAGVPILMGNKAFLGKKVIATLHIETGAAAANVAGAVTNCRSASSEIDVDGICPLLGAGWSLDTATGECSPSLPTIQCDVGQVLTSIQGGVPVCRDIGIDGLSCGAGEFIVELGIEHILCDSPAVVTTTPTPITGCPAQLVNWTQGAESCSGTLVAALPEAGTAVITDPAPDPAGTVDVTCTAGTLQFTNATCSSSPTITPAPGGCWGDPTPLSGAPMPAFPPKCTTHGACATLGEYRSLASGGYTIKCEDAGGVMQGFYGVMCEPVSANCIQDPAAGSGLISSGCFVDTPACDVFSENSCNNMGYTCHTSRSVVLSVGDTEIRSACHGAGPAFDAKTFADPSLYTITWTGTPCTPLSGGTQCVYNPPGNAGNLSVTVTVVRNSDGATVHTNTITANWSNYHDNAPSCPPIN